MERGAASQPRRARIERQERELEFARILAFSDGVFAIAITLLVLQLEVPQDVNNLGGELSDQLPDLLAFAISFAVLGRIWWAFHHRLFSGLTAFDGRLIALNFIYLALAVLVPFSSDLIGDYGDKTEAVVVYAANLGLLSLVGALMLRYAARHGLMRPDAVEDRAMVADASAYTLPIVFLASIPVAFVSPFAATMMWLLNFFTGRGARRLSERRRAG
ncbi:MAG: TMEM175 family protein [Solirubrobacterales bacterium]